MNAIRSGAMVGGKYRLDAALAQGGMGSVWTARHVLLDVPVAIKFIGPEAAACGDARRRFEREAKAAARLQSPHVVLIHDYGIDDDTPYLVMELLEGEDLGTRLGRRVKLSLPETVALVTQVTRALRRAAEAGVVHRDLKPSNVFIIPGEEEETIKVLDFGVAKAPRISVSDDTKLGAVIGSPRYMSPEQARGSALLDHRSDLWSLAVIAYRALTGQLPFKGAHIPDILVNICSAPVPPPSQLEPSLGPEIDAFFAKALAREPELRFQTAREMALALTEAAGQTPVPSVRGGPRSFRALSASSGDLRPAAEGPDPDATVDTPSGESAVQDAQLTRREPSPVSAPSSTVTPPQPRAEQEVTRTRISAVFNAPPTRALEAAARLRPRQIAVSAAVVLLCVLLGSIRLVERRPALAERAEPPRAEPVAESSATPPVASATGTAPEPLASSVATEPPVERRTRPAVHHAPRTAPPVKKSPIDDLKHPY